MMPWDDQPQANLGFSKECNTRDFTQDIGSQQNFKPPLSSPGQSSDREQRGADMHCPDVMTCHWDMMAHYNSDVLYPCSDVVAAWLNDILGME